MAYYVEIGRLRDSFYTATKYYEQVPERGQFRGLPSTGSIQAKEPKAQTINEEPAVATEQIGPSFKQTS